MSVDIHKLDIIDKTRSPKEQLKQVETTFFKEYPNNVEQRDGKMNCLFLFFLVRLDPFHVLNYIFTFDIFFFGILIEGWWVLGYRTGSTRNKFGCSLMVIYLLVIFILAI